MNLYIDFRDSEKLKSVCSYFHGLVNHFSVREVYFSKNVIFFLGNMKKKGDHF